MQWKTNRNCRKLLLNMACCNVFFYMQGAWYVAKYEAVVRANSIYSSPVQQSDHSIRRVGPRMEKLDNVSIQNWLIDYYLTSSVAISIHVTLYGPRSGIPYFSTNPPPIERSPLSATWGCAEQIWGFEPW